MTYAKKMLLAKMLTSVGLILFACIPFLSGLLTKPEQIPVAAHTHWVGSSYGHVFALPIMMFAIWSNLHGTGRSVRLVAFLGMASVIGIFVAGGISDVSPLYVLVFVVLLLGVLFSIRQTRHN